MNRIMELPPQCFVCRDFKYTKNKEGLYCCSAICITTNDIFDMWDECPYMHKKYLVYE